MSRQDLHQQPVAFFLPDLRMGGAERVMTQLANGFASRGCAVDVVLLRASGAFLSMLSPQVHLVDLRARSAYSGFLPLVGYLKNRKPGVLISALDLTNLIALLARRFSGVAMTGVVRLDTMVSMHWRSSWKKALEQRLMRAIYPWADAVAAVSQAVAQDAMDFAQLPGSKVRTIYNPIIPPDLAELAAAQPEVSGFEPGPVPIILATGRLTASKGFATLLQAFALLRRQRQARLVILGEGPQRAELEDLCRQLGLDEAHVSLPGAVKNPLACMARAQLFVLSSIYEGLPTVLVEALACACPVVSTDCPAGPREILDHGRFGYLTPVNDAPALAQAMVSALDAPRPLPDAAWLNPYRLEYAVQAYLDLLREVQ